MQLFLLPDLDQFIESRHPDQIGRLGHPEIRRAVVLHREHRERPGGPDGKEIFNEVALLDMGLRCEPHRLVEQRKKFAVVFFPGAVAETGEVQGYVLDRSTSSFPGIAGAVRGFFAEIHTAAREDA